MSRQRRVAPGRLRNTLPAIEVRASRGGRPQRRNVNPSPTIGCDTSHGRTPPQPQRGLCEGAAACEASHQSDRSSVGRRRGPLLRAFPAPGTSRTTRDRRKYAQATVPRRQCRGDSAQATVPRLCIAGRWCPAPACRRAADGTLVRTSSRSRTSHSVSAHDGERPHRIAGASYKLLSDEPRDADAAASRTFGGLRRLRRGRAGAGGKVCIRPVRQRASARRQCAPVLAQHSYDGGDDDHAENGDDDGTSDDFGRLRPVNRVGGHVCGVRHLREPHTCHRERARPNAFRNVTR